MKQKKSSFDWYATRQRFSIRKYHIGAASVLLGTALVLGNAATVSADENTPAIVATAEATEVADASQALAVDKTALTQAVEAAKAIDLANKPAELAESFVEVFTQATDVLNSTEATQEDVDAVLTKLNTAVEAIQAATTVEVAPTALGTPVATPDADELAPVAETTEETATEAPAVEEAAEVNNNQASPLNIEFLDANNRVLDPNAIFDGGNGQNMQVKVRVTLQENATDQKVEVTLGNFLSFVSSGNGDEDLQRFATVAGATWTRQILTPSGQKYLANLGGDYTGQTGQQVNYTPKAGVTSFTIPLQLNVAYISGLKGVSTSGTINGSNLGIEKSTPLTVKITSTKNGQISEKTSALNNFSFPTYTDTTIERSLNNGNARGHSTVATNNNNYTAVIPGAVGYGRIVTSGVTGATINTFAEYIEADIVLPKGVSFVKFVPHTLTTTGNPYWQKVTETTNADGVTTVRARTTSPTAGHVYILPEVKIDRSVVTGDSVTVQMGNFNVVQRFAANNTSIPILKNLTNHRIAIAELTANDDIGFFQLIPGVANSTPTIAWDAADAKHYVPLTRWDSNFLVNNLDSTDSREKELHYVFPASEDVEVKGLFLPILNNGLGNENALTTISQIKIKSKNTTGWKTVTFNPALTSGSVTEGRARMKDVIDFGLEPGDVLTEVIVPIGSLKAQTSYTWEHAGEYGNAHIYGYLKSTKNQTIPVATVTLRDKDYDASNSARNQINGTGNLGLTYDSARMVGYVEVVPQQNAVLAHSKTGRVDFTVKSNTGYSYITRTPEEVEKIHVVLPKTVDVSTIQFLKGSKDFTASVTPLAVKAQGDKNIYTFNFDRVGDERFIGQIAKEGVSWRDEEFTVRVNVTNNVESATTVSLDQVVFVETASSRPNIGAFSRRVDPYNLVADDNTLYTNIANTSNRVLTLTKAERLDLTSEAKLSTEGTYREANNNFRILSINEDLDLKVNIGNKLETEVGEIDLYLPIPKQGQNWGANFQSKAFDFGLALKGINVDQKFAEVFDISYYSVAASKLNGTQLTTQQLSTETAQLAYNESTNLIRIKSKPGVKVPAATNLPITLRMGLLGVTTAQDGKSITWNPYFSAIYSTGSSVDKARDINMSVALGKVGFTFFTDTNADGSKAGAEAAFTGTAPVYEIFDSANKKVTLTGLTTASRGGTVVNGLTSTQNYTVRLTAPTGFRFTTGTKGAGATTTTHTLTAALTVVDSVVLDNIGLTPVITITDPAKVTVNDIKNVSAAEKVSITDAVKAANANKFPANTRFDVAADGTVTVTYPDGFTQTIAGTKTVQQRATSAAPTINAIDNDDTTISGTGVVGATITVNIPGQGTRTVQVPTGGRWTITGVTPLATGANVTVTQTEPNKLVSPTVTKAVVAAPSAKPVINKIDTDDRTITGTGVPGATIRVTVPGVATPIVAQVGTNGQWSVPLTTPLTAGQTVTATQTEPNKAATAADPKTVERTQADQYNPTAKTPHTVAMGSTPVAKDALNTTGLPATGVKYEWATAPDTRTAGTNRTGVVRVTYADGSVDLVNVSLTVTDQRQLADIHEPIGQDITINAEESVTPISRIVNTNQMPPNTTYEWENGAPDLRVSGTSRLAYVKVKYSDGSSDSVQVRINIRPNMAQLNIPQGQVPGNLRLSMSLTPESLIKNVAALPANTKFTWSAQPNMTTRGAKVARVRVTYTDGSTEEVIVRFNLR